MDLEWKKFHTQRELLEYLGKNSSDNKLVSRLINKWWVYVEWGIYHYIGKVEVKDLIKEIKNLSENIGSNTGQGTDYLAKKNSNDSKAENTLIADLQSDLEYLNWEYAKLENDILRYQEAIRQSYLYIKNTLKGKVNRPTYKEIIKLGWDLPWEDNQ